MPDSPLRADVVHVSYAIQLDGTPIKDEYNVLKIEVQRAINKVATASVAILLNWGESDDKSFAPSESDDFKPGREIEIKLGYDSEEETVFKGIITNHSIKARSGQRPLLIARCCDKAVRMTLGRKSTYYKEQRDSDIIDHIIDEYGLDKEVEATNYTHQQLIKYHAVDWDFIIARAEANGMFAYTQDGKVLVKKPLSSGRADLRIDYNESVYDFDGEIDARFQLPDATAKSWDPKTQDLVEGASSEPPLHDQGNISGKTLSGVMNLSEFDLQSAGPIDEDELTNWAKGALLKSRLSAIRGSVTFFGNARPRLNTLIELAGFGDRFNKNALITSIHHSVSEGSWNTKVGFGLSSQWFHEQQPISAPPAAGLLPAIHGLQNGTVKKIDADPNGEHRIQVDVPMIAKSGDGIWARLANFYATSGKGTFFMPEVGDEVVLGFLNNDPRYAVILGSLYSSKITPPYTADAENSIKAFITKNDLKIELNDKDKILTIETPGGNKCILSDKDRQVTVQDQSGNKIEMASAGITLKSAADINIKATGNVNIEGVKISVKGSAGVMVEGANVEAKAHASFKAIGTASAELSAGGITTVKGATVMIN